VSVNNAAKLPLTLERQQARLLACDAYHVIFTLPLELHALWLANGRELASVLFHAAWAMLSELLGDPKYLGATPGMIAVLHTWGQTLVLHPHLHCLVTGGGWDGEQWRAVRHGYLVPARVVMPVFRGKLLAAVQKAVDAEQLTLPPQMTLPQLRMLLHRLGRQKWHVQLVKSPDSCKPGRQRTRHFAGVGVRLLGVTDSLRVRLACASSASCALVVVQTH